MTPASLSGDDAAARARAWRDAAHAAVCDAVGALVPSPGCRLGLAMLSWCGLGCEIWGTCLVATDHDCDDDRDR